ncbi:hypothetical protein Fmac_029175 [Flemingia macrophylla]|uniref:Cupin type-1 domain-containing protein n=1 Tax=Flemingia macrophylla TaxID=520843 RepID=A0ABD1L9N9_9FABA
MGEESKKTCHRSRSNASAPVVASRRQLVIEKMEFSRSGAQNPRESSKGDPREFQEAFSSHQFFNPNYWETIFAYQNILQLNGASRFINTASHTSCRLNNILLEVFVNGKFCKDPKLVKAEDFFRHVEAGNTSNPLGAQVTQVFVDQLPGLNTLGVSLARIDFAPKGLNPPHTHPRGTEILIVIEGTLYVGFVTSNQNNNRLFTKVLNKGDVFVFPIGLIHFQLNVGHGNAMAIAGLSSQSPGTITIANSLFNATPPISTEVLTKAFQVDKNTIANLQKQFCFSKNLPFPPPPEKIFLRLLPPLPCATATIPPCDFPFFANLPPLHTPRDDNSDS